MANTATVRASMDAYKAQDRTTAESLLSDEFRFTSPQDEHIDKAAFMERCFPTADRFVSDEIVQLVDIGEDDVFLMYEYELQNGERYRNVEFTTVRDGQIVEAQVFFGGRVDAA